MKRLNAKIKILELYKKGFSIHEIFQDTGYKLALIKVHISQYEKKTNKKEGFFNVNQLDCWVFPSSKVN